MKITIEGGPENHWTVSMDDRSCPHLCWDEMLGQVAKLSLGMEPPYMMKTDAEWAEYACRMSELSSKRGEV